MTMNEEDNCWCGSMLKDKPHNCIGTRSRVEGLLDEKRRLLLQVNEAREIIRALHLNAAPENYEAWTRAVKFLGNTENRKEKTTGKCPECGEA